MRERIIVDPYGSRVLGEFATSLTRLTSEHAALDEELRFYFENAPSKGRPSLNRIQKNMEYVSMKPHWLLLLDPFVAGYSLRTREFCMLVKPCSGRCFANDGSYILRRWNS